KGFPLFVEALKRLVRQSPEVAEQIRRVTFLGAVGETAFGYSERLLSELQQSSWEVEHVANLDSLQARQFLADNASAALAVMPSKADHFPYEVIEATLTPGLRLI